MALLLPSRLQQALNFSGAVVTRRASRFRCSAIAVDASSRLAGGVSGIRWGSSTLQGPRSEMEDVVVLRSDGLSGFTFATVFDGHAGISSVEFLRDELYKECMNELRGGLLLGSKDFHVIKDALTNAFENADGRLLVLSRKGKAEVLTSPHRPFGSNKVSMEEARRIRAAGGWVSDAVNFVRNHLRQHGDVQLACEALAQAALDRRSQDNISVVIADLRTDWQNLPDQRPNMFFEAGQAFVTVGIVSLGIWVAYFLFL
ncbi:hypothetical protein KFK09_026426 [Dendrobium nobile]|uniref:protein-serine/threonine phosphatase n=1 Tax=Dendrobium nobile TaxID=94219 RepID=A0A8T3A7H4_DENNO|nr:hypothetical protein KFK09_026426 [Dendrobium nobile]